MEIRDNCFFFGVMNGQVPACFLSSVKIGGECKCEKCKNFVSRNMARIVVKDWLKRKEELNND